MHLESDKQDLDNALRHCEAGCKALQLAVERAQEGTVYPPHCYVVAVELARAIELAMGVALRQD